MSGPGSAFTPDSNDADVVIVQCSFPKCTAEPMTSGPLCATHMMDMTNRTSMSKSILERELSYQTTKARLLPENELSGFPILRRKTGPIERPLQSKPLSSSAGRPEPKPKVSPTSHKAPPQSQNIRSPPDSPKREAGPQRKRMRLTHSPDEGADPRSSRDSKPMPGEISPEDKSKQWRDRHSHSNGATPRGDSTSRYGQKLDPSGKDSTKRLSRPHVIRKTAMPPTDFRFIEQPGTMWPAYGQPSSRASLNRASSGSATPGVNGTTTNGDKKMSPESTQTETSDFGGNKALRAWFSKYQSTGPFSQPNRPKHAVPDASGSKPIYRDPDRRESFTAHKNIQKPTTIALPMEKQEIRESPDLVLQFPVASQPIPIQPMPKKTKPGPKADEPQVQRPPSKPADESTFDALIYRQAGASAPPPGVRVQKPESPPKSQPRDKPHYAHIDPRIHWQQDHSEKWRQAKQSEIEKRGGRKANLGKAAIRMRDQRLREDATDFADRLPERIQQDPAWVRALETLHEAENGAATNEKLSVARQGLRRQPSASGAGMSRRWGA